MCPATDHWIKTLLHIWLFLVLGQDRAVFSGTWMDTKDIMLSEVIQKERDRHRMITFIKEP